MVNYTGARGPTPSGAGPARNNRPRRSSRSSRPSLFARIRAWLKSKTFGDHDAVFPILVPIVFPIVVILVIATMTVGDRTIPLPTWLGFLAVLAWLFVGLWALLIGPIVTWTRVDIKYKGARMLTSIVVGILYFVVSFILMFHSSRPI